MAEPFPILIDPADIQSHVPVDPWTELAETLLRNLRSAHSRRAYATSLRDFFAVCQRPPGEVTKKDIIAYRDELREQAYSAATIIPPSRRHPGAIPGCP